MQERLEDEMILEDGVVPVKRKRGKGKVWGRLFQFESHDDAIQWKSSKHLAEIGYFTGNVNNTKSLGAETSVFFCNARGCPASTRIIIPLLPVHKAYLEEVVCEHDHTAPGPQVNTLYTLQNTCITRIIMYIIYHIHSTYHYMQSLYFHMCRGDCPTYK